MKAKKEYFKNLQEGKSADETINFSPVSAWTIISFIYLSTLQFPPLA